MFRPGSPKLKSQAKLRARKAQIEFDLDQPPTQLASADLVKISEHIGEIITNGRLQGQEGLFEALIERVEIKSDEAVVPHFCIPVTRNDQDRAFTTQPLINYWIRVRFAYRHIWWTSYSATRTALIADLLVDLQHAARQLDR